MTSYDTVYSRFLSSIEDYGLAELCEEDFYDTLYGYLKSAIARFRACHSDLGNRDEEAQCFNEDLLDIEIEILSLLMVRAWVEPQLRSESITRQAWSGKETKFFSQAQHMGQLSEMYENAIVEAHKLMRDYTYQNTNEYFKS